MEQRYHISHSRRRSFFNRTLLTLMLVVLLSGGAIGGTLAWLTSTPEPVVNSFTTGDINITLAESEDLDLKLIPGKTITKDPVVTVEKDSEACYLFVKLEEANWPAVTEAGTDTRKVEYALADGWTAGTGTGEGGDGIPTNVYYRTVSAVTADTDFYVLADNQVTVSENLTKTEMNAITIDPTLTITAYAIQSDFTGTVAEAWAKLNPAD